MEGGWAKGGDAFMAGLEAMMEAGGASPGTLVEDVGI